MILFFGTRPGKKKEYPLPELPCPHCGQRGTLSALVIPHYVHLFWIPVYRLRPMRSIACSHCRGVFDPGDFNPGERERLKALEP